MEVLSIWMPVPWALLLFKSDRIPRSWEGLAGFVQVLKEQFIFGIISLVNDFRD
jgi:hypothetical protein